MIQDTYPTIRIVYFQKLYISHPVSFKNPKIQMRILHTFAYLNLVRILQLLIEQKLLIKKKKKLIEQKTTHDTYPDLKIHFTC